MLAYRFAQAALLIRDDQRNALESATFPPVEGLAPGGKAVAQPNAENLALAIAAQSAETCAARIRTRSSCQLRINSASTRMKGYSESSRRSLNDLTRASSPAHSALTLDLEKLAPHSSSVIAVTWRVDTLCTTIAIRASTNACSLL